MERLSEIIGPAPSEMSFEELLKKITLERYRISTILYTYRTAPIAAPRKAGSPAKAKKVTKTAVQKLMAAEGISAEELAAILKAKKEGKF